MLRQTGNKFILDYYEQNNTLTAKLKRLLIRTIAQFMVKSKNGVKPSPSSRRQIALAVQSLFVSVFPNIDVLLSTNSNYGILGKALTNAVASFKKQSGGGPAPSDPDVAMVPDVGMEEDAEINMSLQVTIEEQNDDDFDENIEYLRNVVVTKNEVKKIGEVLTKTQKQRHESIKKGNPEFIFDIYFVNPYFIKFDYNLLFPELPHLDESTINNVRAFCLKEMEKIDKRFHIGNDLDLFKSLINLCGKTSGGTANANKMLYETCNENTGIEGLKDIAGTRNQPFIIIRESEPNQYLIGFDSKILALDTRRYESFGKAFNILFKMFYVFHLKFPEELKKLYTFFARAIYKVPASIGRSYILQELLHSYEQFVMDEAEDETSTDDESTQNTNDESSD